MRSRDAAPEQRPLFNDNVVQESARPESETAATAESAASNEASPAFGRNSLFAEDDPFVQPPVPVTTGRSADSAQRSTASPGLETTPSRENDWAGLTSLDDLKPRILACAGCGLREGARGVVFGEGDPHARIMLVGEGPGQTEDETGRPFVGRAGQLLDALLRTVGFERREVFIANIVKCRPPGNRLPLPPEVEVCIPHLRAQIRVIDPQIIVLLGALSCQTLVDPALRVTRDRGKWFQRDGRDYLVTFHPAAVLRDEANKRPLVLQDFRGLRAKWENLAG